MKPSKLNKFAMKSLVVVCQNQCGSVYLFPFEIRYPNVHNMGSQEVINPVIVDWCKVNRLETRSIIDVKTQGQNLGKMFDRWEDLSKVILELFIDEETYDHVLTKAEHSGSNNPLSALLHSLAKDSQSEKFIQVVDVQLQEACDKCHLRGGLPPSFMCDGLIRKLPHSLRSLLPIFPDFESEVPLIAWLNRTGLCHAYIDLICEEFASFWRSKNA